MCMHLTSLFARTLAKVFGGLGPLGASDTGESLLHSFTNLGVRISFAVLQGLILRVLTTGNPDEMRFRQRLDALNFMMADQRMPVDVQRKARLHANEPHLSH